MGESCITYFKLRIKNESNFSIIFLDNSLIELSKGLKTPSKSGFFIKNKDSASINPLGINNFYYQKVLPKSNSFYFLGGNNIKKCSNAKDSISFREDLSKSLIKYNGQSLNLDNLTKSPYVSELQFNNFIKEKNKYKPFIDNISLQIPKNIKIKYLYKMPILKQDWDKL